MDGVESPTSHSVFLESFIVALVGLRISPQIVDPIEEE